jgi:hypothetical protein
MICSAARSLSSASSVPLAAIVEDVIQLEEVAAISTDDEHVAI